MMLATLLTTTLTRYFDTRFTGPTSGPEGIRVGPASAESGRFRARTHNDDNGDDDDDDDDDSNVPANTNTSSITLTVYWNVRVFSFTCLTS